MSLTRRSFVKGLSIAACTHSAFSGDAGAATHEPPFPREAGVEGPSLYTGGCSLPGAGSEASYNIGSGRTMLADTRCHMILHHDYALREDGWIYIPVTRQALPICANVARPVQNLTTGVVAKIVYGKVTSWEELGGGPGLIRVAIRRSADPGSSGVEADRFNHLLRRGGIEPSRVEGNVEYVDNYQQLAELIRRDKNVLGFGLRGVPFHGLRILAVNGMSPTVPDGYPFSTLISLATRKSGKGYSLMTKYLRQARQRFEQDRRNLSNFRVSSL